MRALVEACLRQRWVVIALALMFAVVGVLVVDRAAFDAFPEFAPPRVEVQTEAPGLSSEEVEALVTMPIEAAVAGTPKLAELRSKSVLGLSSVVMLFEPGTDLMQARMLVQERLARAATQLPAVARAPVMLSPLSSTSRILEIGMWSPKVLTALGRTIDTMVIAGLVIALGEVVDDAIIDVENIHRRLRIERESGRTSAAHALTTVLEASLEVRSAIVYASLIVVLVFVPVLMLQGVAGEFFRPLAIAYGLAVVASTLVALTVTPALSLVLLPGGLGLHARSPIARVTSERYGRVVEAALARPRTLLWGAAAAIAVSVVGLSGLREQFLPSFRENDFLMHWVARPGTSLEAVRRSADLARKELLSVPGVRNLGAHIGRAEVADEVVGPNFAELWISVDPKADLPATLARVRAVVDGYPGVYRDVQTYLQERVREVLSGGSGAMVVRLYGPSLSVLREQAISFAHEVERIPGVSHAKPESQVLVPQIEVTPDLARCAALGIDPGVVRARASTLVQGETVGQVVRGQQPIDVVVWSVERVRADVAAISDLAIALDDRTLVRLGDVADVRVAPMQNTIAHDAASRKLDVVVDLDEGADLGAVASAIEARLATQKMPPGHHGQLLGEHLARTRARSRLLFASVFALLGIALVLLADFRSARLTLLVLASLPFALVGGIAAVVLSGGAVSLGTLVGLVTVIGIAARNGIMLISHFRHLEREERVPFGATLVVRGAKERLVPIVMTALATGLALLPLIARGNAPRRGLGDETQLVLRLRADELWPSLETDAGATSPADAGSAADAGSTVDAGTPPVPGSVGALDAYRATVNQPPTTASVAQKFPGALRITPGAHAESLIWLLAHIRGNYQMPPLVSHKVDEVGMAQLADWIDSLPHP